MSFEAFAALVLAVNLLCAIVAAFIAGRSGRDPFGWVLVCSVLGPFGIVALLAARGQHPAGEGPAAPGGRVVLVPVDGSAPSLDALDRAIRRAREGGATVVAMTVLPVERSDDAAGTPGSAQRSEYEAEVASHLGEAERRLKTAGVAYSVRTSFGDPGEQVLSTARELNAESIFMGRRGRGGVAKLLLGSVSDKVVKHADVPVTVVG